MSVNVKAYSGNDPYIFVSYSHKDGEIVLPIIEKLQEKGYRIWFDEGIKSGTEWCESIEERIENCTTFLIFMSHHVNESENCKNEIHYAQEERKTILLGYIETCELGRGLRLVLKRKQAIYMENYNTIDLFVEKLMDTDCVKESQNIEQDKQSKITTAKEQYNKARECYGKGDFGGTIKWLRLAAEQGYVYAQYALGDFYYKGECGLQKNEKEAVEWYCLAAKQGYPEAQYKLGDCYYKGEGGLKRSYQVAAKWYEYAAKKGNTEAQDKLGDCYYKIGNQYYHGIYVQQSYEEAAKWYERAAEQGHIKGQVSCGNCYFDGKGVEQDFQEAAKWYERAVNQGDYETRYKLEKCYEKLNKSTYRTENVEENYSKEMITLMHYAEQGDACEQYKLGNCYFNGEHGVLKDLEQAIAWYRCSAKSGFVHAQYKLAECYYNGEGVRQNYKEAVEWYQKAAEQDDRRAQYKLALCYCEGKGVEVDYKKAKRYLRESASHGYKPAKEALVKGSDIFNQIEAY